MDVSKQVEECSDLPSRKASILSHDERWADVDDEPSVVEAAAKSWQAKPIAKVSLAREVFAEESSDDEPVGKSQDHDSGRCKPCAFFHTKGCQSGAACQFCHRCPAHEKQRRKRLRRRLCRNTPYEWGRKPQGDDYQHHAGKAGHSRMGSVGTASTCSGWMSNTDQSQFAHSRTGSTASSSQATGIGDNVDGNMSFAQSPTEQLCLPMFAASPQSMSPQAVMPVVMIPTCEELIPTETSGDSQRPEQPIAAGLFAGETSPQEASTPSNQSLDSTPKSPTSGSDQAAMYTAQNGQVSFTFDPQLAAAAESMPGVPVGYVASSCGTYSYAIVPIPLAAYGDGGGFDGGGFVVPAQYQAMPVCSPEQQWSSPSAVSTGTPSMWW